MSFFGYGFFNNDQETEEPVDGENAECGTSPTEYDKKIETIVVDKEPAKPVILEQKPKPVLDKNIDGLALTNSTIFDYAQGLKDRYEAARKEFEAQKKLPFIYFLVKAFGPESWPATIDHGFKVGNFTIEDIMWVIAESAKPYYLAKDQADSLFSNMIINKLKKSGPLREVLIELLTSVSMVPTNGWFERYPANTKLSPLAYMLEDAYYSPKLTDQFAIIVENLPANIENKVAMEYSEGDAHKTLTITAWIHRQLMKGYSQYIKPALHIVDLKLKEDVNKNIYISIELGGLIDYLYSQTYLPLESYKGALLKYKK